MGGVVVVVVVVVVMVVRCGCRAKDKEENTTALMHIALFELLVKISILYLPFFFSLPLLTLLAQSDSSPGFHTALYCPLQAPPSLHTLLPVTPNHSKDLCHFSLCVPFPGFLFIILLCKQNK